MKFAASTLIESLPNRLTGTHEPSPGWNVKKPKLPFTVGNGDVGGSALLSRSERQTALPVAGSITASIAAK